MDYYIKLAAIIITFLMLIAASVQDYRKRKISNRITFPGIIIGLVLNSIVSWQNGLICFAIIVGLFFIGIIGIFGMGDLKLVMATVALQGYFAAGVTIVFACVVLVVLKVFKQGYKADFRRLINSPNATVGERVPFAPFMLLGYCAYFFTYVFTPQGFFI